MKSQKLILLGALYGVCRFSATADIPTWAMAGAFFSITRTEDELSIICLEEFIPPDVKCEKGWRVIKMEGPFEFSEIGILAGILTPLAGAGVSILAVSTFDTDYVLVKDEQLEAARTVLLDNGFQVN